MFMPHYMSDDMFLVLIIAIIGLVIIAVLAVALAYSENRRAAKVTKLLQESRLQAFELDPQSLSLSNVALRERVARADATITQQRHLLDVYGEYVDRLVAGGAVLTEPKPSAPAEVKLVHPETGLPIRKQPEGKAALFSNAPQPAPAGS